MVVRGDVGTLFVEMGESVSETDIMEMGLPDEDRGYSCWRWSVLVEGKIGTMVIEDVQREDCEDGS